MMMIDDNIRTIWNYALGTTLMLTLTICAMNRLEFLCGRNICECTSLGEYRSHFESGKWQQLVFSTSNWMKTVQTTPIIPTKNLLSRLVSNMYRLRSLPVCHWCIDVVSCFLETFTYRQPDRSDCRTSSGRFPWTFPRRTFPPPVFEDLGHPPTLRNKHNSTRQYIYN